MKQPIVVPDNQQGYLNPQMIIPPQHHMMLQMLPFATPSQTAAPSFQPLQQNGTLPVWCMPQPDHKIKEDKTPPYINHLPPYISPPPQFKRKRYVLESLAFQKSNITKSSFRKNNDNFLLLPEVKALIALGPRRTYCKEMGLICAFECTEEKTKSISVGESSQICEEYAAWIRKKLRLNPEVETRSKIINIAGRVDVPEDIYEISLFDLFLCMKAAFPHWKIVYDPEVCPIIVLQRINHSEKSNVQDASTVKRSRTEKSGDDDEFATPLHRTKFDLQVEDENSSSSDILCDSTPPRNSKSDQQTEKDIMPSVDRDPTKADNMTDDQQQQQQQVLNKDAKGISNIQNSPDQKKNLEFVSQPTDNFLVPSNSPMEVLIKWMLLEERKAYMTANSFLTSASDGLDDQMIDNAKTNQLYEHIPGWLKCVIIITSKSVVIHKATKDADLDLSWMYFFPFLRRFLVQSIARDAAAAAGIPPTRPGLHSSFLLPQQLTKVAPHIGLMYRPSSTDQLTERLPMFAPSSSSLHVFQQPPTEFNRQAPFSQMPNQSLNQMGVLPQQRPMPDQLLLQQPPIRALVLPTARPAAIPRPQQGSHFQL